jgi:hypothetical protein
MTIARAEQTRTTDSARCNVRPMAERAACRTKVTKAYDAATRPALRAKRAS